METCPPPDPHPKRPRILPPPKSTDCHFHVIGPRARFPYAPKRTYDPPEAPLEAALRLHDILGLERGIAVQVSVHGKDNRAMLDALARSAGRFRGVAMVDEQTSDTELEAMHGAGVRGAHFNFVKFLGGPPDLGVFRRVSDRVAELGWHVDIHADGEDLIEHEELFGSLGATVLMEYWGHVDVAKGPGHKPFQLLLQMIEDYGWWSKIANGDRISAAGAPYADTVPFARAVIEAAPDRTIWGTDWPHPKYLADGMPNDGDLVDLLFDYTPDEAVRRKVLVDNPAALYDFED